MITSNSLRNRSTSIDTTDTTKTRDSSPVVTEFTGGSDNDAGDYGTINVGDSGPGPAVETGTANDGTVAAVETSKEIKDAGGPSAVIADTSTEANKAAKKIGSVTNQLEKAAGTNEADSNPSDGKVTTTNDPKDIPKEAVTAAKNAANAVTGKKDGKSGGMGKIAMALVAGIAAIILGGMA